MPPGLHDHQSVLFPARNYLSRRAKICGIRDPTCGQTGEFWVGATAPGKVPGTAIFLRRRLSCLGRKPNSCLIRIAQSILPVVQSALIGLTAQRPFGNASRHWSRPVRWRLYPFFLLFYQGPRLSRLCLIRRCWTAIAALHWWSADRGFFFDKAFEGRDLPVAFVAATWTKPTLTMFIAAAADRPRLPCCRHN